MVALYDLYKEVWNYEQGYDSETIVANGSLDSLRDYVENKDAFKDSCEYEVYSDSEPYRIKYTIIETSPKLPLL